MLLRNKRAIITGGSGGLGQAIALALSAAGANIAISYCNDRAGADTVVQRASHKAFAYQTDFHNTASVTSFIQQATKDLGGIDILINNAGITGRPSLLEITEEDFDRVFAINLKTPLLILQAAAKQMIAQETSGTVVNISSIAGVVATPYGLLYTSSKAALNRLTEVAALELAPHQIRVNAVAPGRVAAGMNKGKAEQDPEKWAQIQKTIPLGRYGTPDDIAQMVLYLASPNASWITGQVISVDGGNHFNMW